VEKDTEAWGLEVTGIRIQDIDMPEDLKKIDVPSSLREREKRATITKAEAIAMLRRILLLRPRPWRKVLELCSSGLYRRSMDWSNGIEYGRSGRPYQYHGHIGSDQRVSED